MTSPAQAAATNGTDATARPSCSQTSDSSTSPRPSPSYSSATVTPNRPTRASSAHSSRSNRSGVASTASSRDGVPTRPNTSAARERISCWVSSRSKFMSAGPPLHAEPGRGDDLALDLVDAAAEGVDLRGSGEPFYLAAERCTRRPGPQPAARSEHTEQLAADEHMRLGPVELRGGGIRGLQPVARDRLDHLPVEQLH